MELEKRVLRLIENDSRLNSKTIAVMLEEDEER